MGYRRNELARAVAVGKNYVLGFLQHRTEEQEARVLYGVLQGAAEAGYSVKVVARGAQEHYREVAHHCVEQRLAGLIVRRFLLDEIVELNQELDLYGLPQVFVDDNPEVAGVCYVTSDDDQGYRLAVEHLLALGHQRIALIGGDSKRQQPLLRKQSFRRLMQEHGLSAPDEFVLDSDFDALRAGTLTQRLFQEACEPPTALICDGDYLAAGVLRALFELGLRVPQDVSVVGYGGFSFAGWLYPPLTTVAQPFEEMGSRAVWHLLRQIEAKEKGSGMDADLLRPEMLPTHLIVAQSTGPVCMRR